MTDQKSPPRTRRFRGVHRIWDPRVWGTIIGAVGATVFVWSNRGALPAPIPLVATLAWAAALLLYLTFVFVTPRTFGPMQPVGAKAGLVYLGSVAGMLVLIQVGTLVLNNAGKTELGPSLTVIAVGLHFLPFAAVFHTPMFIPLGTIMAALGTAGLVLGWNLDVRAGASAAVIAGLVMLILIALDAARATHHKALPEPAPAK